MDLKVTSEFLVSAVAVLLSLLFMYIPGLNAWYAAKSVITKRLFMLVLLVVTSSAVFGLGCANILTTDLVCAKSGAIELIQLIGIAVWSNQATFLITPAPMAVKVAKLEPEAIDKAEVKAAAKNL
jgi:hypothetical protein